MGGFNLGLVSNVMSDFDLDMEQRVIFWDKAGVVIEQIKRLLKRDKK